jgi:lysophospholipase L1-like esterase
VPPGVNPAIFPAPRNPWMVKFTNNCQRARQGGVDLLFQGDSITEGWMVEGKGKEIWNARYGKLRAACFGIAGDATEQVLWRIQQGEMAGLSPKLIVLMIGTNNVLRDTVPQMAEGVTEVVRAIRTACPESHLLLLAIFPRSEKPDSPVRLKLAAVNQLIAPLAADPAITFLDISSVFLAADGTLSKDIMPDFLHPNRQGHELWADAIEPMIKKYVPASE